MSKLSMSKEIVASQVATAQIAVIIPCYNEAATIGKVVNDFRQVLPNAEIYVYDNNSSDATIINAKAAGAIVRSERRQGKGYVVRRMFSDVQADVYVLVDGDDTYDATAATSMIERLLDGQLDMVNGQRIGTVKESYRFGHRFGNRVLTGMVGWLFGRQFNDILSGYRVMSHRFVKTFPCLSRGFEIETELTVHALEIAAPLAEMPTIYRERPPNSHSKLNTYRDGFRILLTILRLLKEEHPMRFFSAVALAFIALAAILAYPLIVTFVETSLVPRLPTAVLIVGLVILGCISFTCGVILENVTLARHEMKRLWYLSFGRSNAQ